MVLLIDKQQLPDQDTAQLSKEILSHPLIQSAAQQLNQQPERSIDEGEHNGRIVYVAQREIAEAYRR